MRNDRERHVPLLINLIYAPHHLDGLFALLLFFIALLLGAAVAIGIHSLISLS